MKALPIVLFLSMVSLVHAQNLVPNPSFESEDTLPIFCGIYLPADFNPSVYAWINPTDGSPDLFSTMINQSCWNFQPNSTYAGPICLKGPQLPRTGHVMAGMFCYTIAGLNQREYVQTQLLSPLIPGNIYYVEFYASLADNTESFTDRLGAYFSDAPVSSVTDDPLPFVPQITSANNISDTSVWTKISGTFQATSAATYITIGNFYDDNSTITGANPGGGTGPGCYGVYYFIDDVSVIDFTTGISEKKQPVARVYPNPAHERIFVTSADLLSCFILYDPVFKEITRSYFANSTTIETGNLAPGIYFYEVVSDLGRTRGKIVIE